MESDYLIIGAGVIGLTLAYELKTKYPERTIAVIEKEEDVALHASGRNSGVLHAGFYYTSDSLKAKFTVEGNRMMKQFCKANDIFVNECQKVVVASDERELKTLLELYERGLKNGVDVRLIDKQELRRIEPNAETFEKALYSPNTASVDPEEVCLKLKELLLAKGVVFYFNCGYKKRKADTIITTQGVFSANKIINTAGLYADKIAKDFGFCKNMTIIPFKGIYVKTTSEEKSISTNIYPVPNLLNPFLGVHFTVTAHNDIKIGPTSIPAFWRENYQGWGDFKLGEFFQIAYYEAKLFFTNAFNFRRLAKEEMKKYKRSYFVGLARKMVKQMDEASFNKWVRPGIRAQLLDTKTLELIMDFKIEGDEKTVHVLNAISPAFTCSFPFSRHIIKEMKL